MNLCVPILLLFVVTDVANAQNGDTKGKQQLASVLVAALLITSPEAFGLHGGRVSAFLASTWLLLSVSSVRFMAVTAASCVAAWQRRIHISVDVQRTVGPPEDSVLSVSSFRLRALLVDRSTEPGFTTTSSP